MTSERGPDDALPPARTLAGLSALRARGIGANVIALGVTSFFTDVSTEMVAATLPAWLLAQHGFHALGFASIDAVWRGSAAIAGLVLALAADRWRRRKLVAGAGYALSAACKPFLLLAVGSWPLAAGILCADRVGKGVRAAPRDALISLASDERVRATAFGVHRSLDTLGMVLGPFAAFAILAAAPGRFDAIVVASTCAALVGLAALSLFVEERRTSDSGERAPRFRDVVAQRSLRLPLVLAAVLGIASAGEMQLLVLLERRGAIEAGSIALLFGLLATAQLVFTMPAARAADRFGRARTFVAAHALLLVAYATLALPALDGAQPWLALGLIGGFLAATDGVLAAVASVASPPDSRAASIAAVVATSGLARMAASLAFGAVWSIAGPTVALAAFAVALFLALASCTMLLRTPHATSERA